MDEETLRVLLDQKLSFLGIIAQTTMTWWVSSAVFCATAIAVFWVWRDDVVKLPGLNMICFMVSVFLFAFPLYAIWIIISTKMLGAEAQHILANLSGGGDLLIEFQTVMVAIAIGGIVFLLMFFTWLFIWKMLIDYRSSCGP